jgi:Haem-dependent oxidative N-demethylase, alpha subunit-like
MTQDWSRLFADSGFRWQMGLRTGDAQSFFAPTPENREILAERNSCLNESPADYAVMIDAGRPLLEETHQFAVACGALDPAADNTLETLGRALEPDFVLLLPSPDGPVVAGGVVCFPSSWALPEKIGRTLHETHGPVPALNPQLGERIRTALDRLSPGAAWERENWGLSRDGKRNHHPHREWKRLDETVEPDEIWFRLERQFLYRLPQTGGILFGIRLEITPWHELIKIETARAGLRRAFEAMPPEIASYKGLATASPRILGWLTDR